MMYCQWCKETKYICQSTILKHDFEVLEWNISILRYFVLHYI